jgi:hypothetical protein
MLLWSKLSCGANESSEYTGLVSPPEEAEELEIARPFFEGNGAEVRDGMKSGALPFLDASRLGLGALSLFLV